jgi:hypothetical protein
MKPLLLFLFLVPAALAEDPKPAAPAAPAGPITYELRDLKPAGFTQYTGTGDAVRQYFDFKNDQGTHHVIYEEVAAAAPARTVQGLRQAAVAYDSECSMDIECASKAFCLQDCKQMYYETANAPGDAIAPDRNKCHLVYFTCQQKNAASPRGPVADFQAPPPAPSTTPAAAPPASP